MAAKRGPKSSDSRHRKKSTHRRYHRTLNQTQTQRGSTFYTLSLIGCAEQGTLLGAHGWPLADDSQARNLDVSCCRSAVAQSKVSVAAQQFDLSATWCLDRIHLQGSRINSRPNAQASRSCCAQLPAHSARIRRPPVLYDDIDP